MIAQAEWEQVGQGVAQRMADEVKQATGRMPKEAAEFSLAAFFPYQTRVFYRHVSTAVSQLYEARYGMKPYEWRTLAILGPDNEFTALQIVELSSIDKVSVSRAISAMNDRGWLDMRTNSKDARSRVLKLSEAGREVYADLVPRMLDLEKSILSALTPDEQQELRRLMKKLRG